MAIYALRITPLITIMVELVSTKCGDIKIVTFSDDFSAAATLKSLLQWWTTLLEVGPKLGYYPKPAKSSLITKPETHATGKQLFKDTKVKIANSGKRFLGSVIGTFTFKRQYANEIVSQWISEIKVLSQIDKVEPQTAYCGFTTGFKHKVTYLMRTTPNINEELRQLDDAINNKLIPSFRENKLFGNHEGLLLSLPTKLGGMCIPVFSQIANVEFQNSSLLTKEHVSLIALQERTYEIQKETINNIKKKIKRDIQEYNQQKLIDIKSGLSSQQCRLNDINTEQGDSTWLSFLPIEEEG